jgi:hypothetical protein
MTQKSKPHRSLGGFVNKATMFFQSVKLWRDPKISAFTARILKR